MPRRPRPPEPSLGPKPRKAYHVSRDLDTIERDFGQFPDDAHHNPFGRFIKRKGHKVVLYLGTNTDEFYYALQCETEGCPGRGGGNRIKECPAVKGIRHVYDDSDTDRERAIRNLLFRKSFYYQMVHDTEGRCTYFD